jgi:hypothetical protein
MRRSQADSMAKSQCILAGLGIPGNDSFDRFEGEGAPQLRTRLHDRLISCPLASRYPLYRTPRSFLRRWHVCSACRLTERARFSAPAILSARSAARDQG